MLLGIRDVFCRDHVAISVATEVVYDFALSWQKPCLVKESRHSVHLNQVLDVLFLPKALFGEKNLSMVIQLAATTALRPTAAWNKATAESLENGDDSELPVPLPDYELLSFLKLLSESHLWCLLVLELLFFFIMVSLLVALRILSSLTVELL